MKESFTDLLISTPYIFASYVGVTVLGTGAKWLGVLEEKGVKPRETHNLSALRAILSTGSPLPPRSFKYVYRDIKEDIMLGSISGELNYTTFTVEIKGGLVSMLYS